MSPLPRRRRASWWSDAEPDPRVLPVSPRGTLRPRLSTPEETGLWKLPAPVSVLEIWRGGSFAEGGGVLEVHDATGAVTEHYPGLIRRYAWMFCDESPRAEQRQRWSDAGVRHRAVRVYPCDGVLHRPATPAEVKAFGLIRVDDPQLCVITREDGVIEYHLAALLVLVPTTLPTPESGLPTPPSIG